MTATSKVVWLCTCGSELIIEGNLAGSVKFCPVCGKDEMIAVSDDEYLKQMRNAFDNVIKEIFPQYDHRF